MLRDLWTSQLDRAVNTPITDDDNIMILINHSTREEPLLESPGPPGKKKIGSAGLVPVARNSRDRQRN